MSRVLHTKQHPLAAMLCLHFDIGWGGAVLTLARVIRRNKVELEFPVLFAHADL